MICISTSTRIYTYLCVDIHMRVVTYTAYAYETPLKGIEKSQSPSFHLFALNSHFLLGGL